MDNKTFEKRYEELIPQASLEEVLSLFNEKKKLYSNSILKLIYQKLKDKFTKDKSAHFLELGYEGFKSFDLYTKMYDLALKHERSDVIEYFFENNYVASYLYNFELSKLVVSKKVLSTILNNKELEEKFSPYDYYCMLDKAIMKNLPEMVDLIFEANPKKVKEISKDLQEKLILNAVSYNSKEVFLKLLHTKEPIEFDINLKQDNCGISYERENLLITAAKNKDIETMRYLLTSPELKAHVDLADSIHWIRNLRDSEEIIEAIIFDIKAPLTESLKEILMQDNLHNPQMNKINANLLEKFKRRDLLLKIDEKLPVKGSKGKSYKI